MTQEFDYIVVGAGSAGCVLAARLSEDPATRVLLLEAGPPDRSPWIHLPIGYGKTMWSPTYNWCFHTDPDPNMNGRRIYWPRGKTLGGSSSINGLIYIRGQREDYDHWAALGNAGWGYDDVLPYFISVRAQPARRRSRWHGGDGPLKVSDIGAEARADRGLHRRRRSRLRRAAHRRLQRRAPGRRRLLPADDLEGLALQHGQGLPAAGAQRAEPAHRNRRARHAACCSKAAARSACSYRQGGVDEAARCRGRGACSPPARSSRRSCCSCRASARRRCCSEHGIAVVHALPGVGENLQDHLQMRLIYECTQPITTNDQLNSWLGQAQLGLQWLLRAAGRWRWASTRAAASCARCDVESATPDIQFHVATLSADMAGGKVHPFSGFTMSVCQLRPESRGHVRIRSADPFEPPAMQPNYLATELDRRTAVAGVKAARAIAAAPAMRPYVKREVKPGPEAHDDAALLEFCRNNGATIFHPTGTCSMGTRSDGGGRRAPARARRAGPARGRLLGDAHAGVGQHQCAGGDDGREGGRT